MQKKSKAEEYLAGWQRCKADFLNYKKEVEREKSQWRKYANEDLVLKILPVLDGLEMGIKGLNKALEIKAIEAKKGKKFNPRLHEAISGKGQRVDKVLQKGYKLNDKVIRPARVKLVRKEVK